MKLGAFVKKEAQYIIYVFCGILFFVLGWCYSATNENIINLTFIANKPFEFVANILRDLGEAKNAFSTFLCYFLYIIFCLLPVECLAIRTIKTKKVIWGDIVFVFASVFLFFMMFYFINPMKLNGILDSIATDFSQDLSKQIAELKITNNDIAKLGMANTFWLIIVLGVLFEFSAKLQTKSDRIYVYARHLIYAFVIYLLFTTFFESVYVIKNDIKLLPETFLNIEIDKGINIFVIIFKYVIDLILRLTEIVVIVAVGNFTKDLQKDTFATINANKIDALEKVCKWAIFVIIASQVILNIVLLICHNKLVNFSVNAKIPLTLIFAICLVIIVAKILKKSIKVNEENKLVI